MCTVTYIPVLSRSNKSGFLLTSNRDEKTSRTPAFLPTILAINNKKVAIPLDPVGKGSWIALQENGRTICLLNGGFEPHLQQPPYKHSRGLVVTKYFSYRNANEFAELFDFSQLEPFTLVIVENESLFEFRWDGDQLYQSKLNAKEPYIWSSVTLYTQDVRLKREQLFEAWLSKNYEKIKVQPELVLDFHQFKNDDGEAEGIKINRDNKMRTVSITAIRKTGESHTMQYKDLIHDQSETIRFGIYALEATI